VVKKKIWGGRIVWKVCWEVCPTVKFLGLVSQVLQVGYNEVSINNDENNNYWFLILNSLYMDKLNDIYEARGKKFLNMTHLYRYILYFFLLHILYKCINDELPLRSPYYWILCIRQSSALVWQFRSLFADNRLREFKEVNVCTFSL